MKSIIIAVVATLFFVTSCKNAPQHNDEIPEHTSFTIQSEKVNELRTINVWTPSNYKNLVDSLPVIYMADGGIKEDFPHIGNTLSELILAKKIPPHILVGIENTKRQRDLTGPTNSKEDLEISPEVGKSADFREFILEELVPEINSKFRTNSRKGLLGESLSGLFVVETFLLKPTDFNFYLAFDPSLWWNDHNYDKNVDTYLKNLPDQQTKIWFASSSAEGMADAAQNLENAFKKIAPEKLSWKYSNEPEENHNTIFRATKEKALIWTLSNN